VKYLDGSSGRLKEMKGPVEGVKFDIEENIDDKDKKDIDDLKKEEESDDLHGLIVVGDIHGSLNSLWAVLEVVDNVC
jgi:hypothetical protein